MIVKAETNCEKKMHLSMLRPKVITATDIIPDSRIEITNPEQVICFNYW